MTPFDLNGVWKMESVEGIEGFLADSGYSWVKRKAGAQVLKSRFNPRRFEQHGNRIKSAVERKGEWEEEEFIADGEHIYLGETNGIRAWKRRYWDSDGWLVDEGQNHEGHLRMRFGLLDANTMQMRMSLVVDPPSGNEMVRVYSRDGDRLPASAATPRCAAEESQYPIPPTTSTPEPETIPAEAPAHKLGSSHAGDGVQGTEAADGVSKREDVPEMKESPPALPPPVVFIHGIMGSTLVDGDGSVHYLTLTHALGLHSPSLALPTFWCVACSRFALHTNQCL